MNRLYIFTRKDLVPGYQAVQSCHAAALMGYKDLANWDGHIVLLSVDDLESLQELYVGMFDAIGAYSPKAFYEPDLDHEMTAFAVMLSELMRSVVRDYDLALKKQTTILGWLRGKIKKEYR